MWNSLLLHTWHSTSRKGTITTKIFLITICKCNTLLEFYLWVCYTPTNKKGSSELFANYNLSEIDIGQHQFSKNKIVGKTRKHRTCVSRKFYEFSSCGDLSIDSNIFHSRKFTAKLEITSKCYGTPSYQRNATWWCDALSVTSCTVLNKKNHFPGQIRLHHLIWDNVCVHWAHGPHYLIFNLSRVRFLHKKWYWIVTERQTTDALANTRNDFRTHAS